MIRAALFILAVDLQAQMLGSGSSVLRGEVSGGRSWPADQLMVEIGGQGRPAEKTAVMPDGSFEFRGVADGQYELKVISLYGDIIRRQWVQAPDHSRQLVIKLPDASEQRPITGTVSMKQLLHPPPPKARQEMARAEKTYKQRKMRQSIEHLQKAIELHPDYLEAHNNLGVRHMQTNDFERAAAEFRRAAEIDPGSLFAQTNLSLALTTLKQYRESEMAARRALASNPDYPQARYALGLTLAAQRDCSIEAITNLQKAAELYPKAHIAAARLLACRGRTDEAAAELRMYLAAPNADHRREVESWLSGLAPRAKP